jgi:alpha-beta hydrolase superfamily lysophospholipase
MTRVRRSIPFRVRRIIVRIVVQAALTAFLVFVAFLLGWATLSRGMPEPCGWHTDPPPSEFRARDGDRDGYSFDEYLAQEERVFDELRARVEGPWRAEAGGLSRFNADSRFNPERTLDRNWNRSFVLEHEAPRAGALLVHGLSDSPYSMRALASVLHDRGMLVVGLRVPGHGTCPGALAEASWKDWTSAVRVAALGLRSRLPADAPLLLVGFSNGGALCTHYALEAAEDPSLPRPAGVVLLSPMIAITPMAQIARLHHLLDWIPAFEKTRWQKMDPEIDPFKYSSWPMNANEQALALTGSIERRLRALAKAGRTRDLPQFLAFQSLVDATVDAPAMIRRLFAVLPPGRTDEVVLFDVNRISIAAELLRVKHDAAIQALMASENLPFTLRLVTNEGTDSLGVVARTRAGASLTVEPLGLAWPRGVFSLSHGAIPIPPDDPILGTELSTLETRIPLGSLNLRGEHGVLTISEGLMMRLRHNPFFAYEIERLEDWTDALLRSRAN